MELKKANFYLLSIIYYLLSINIPEGFILKDVPGYKWVIFKCTSAMPHAIQKMWHRVYTEFSPLLEYVPIGDVDFEVYPEGNMDDKNYISEIWIPV